MFTKFILVSLSPRTFARELTPNFLWDGVAHPGKPLLISKPHFSPHEPQQTKADTDRPD